VVPSAALGVYRKRAFDAIPRIVGFGASSNGIEKTGVFVGESKEERLLLRTRRAMALDNGDFKTMIKNIMGPPAAVTTPEMGRARADAIVAAASHRTL
jgi:hypothetical protein